MQWELDERGTVLWQKSDGDMVTEDEKLQVIDWLNEIIENPEVWKWFYSDSEVKTLAENALKMLTDK